MVRRAMLVLVALPAAACGSTATLSFVDGCKCFRYMSEKIGV